MNIEISIVIPTYKRYESLLRLLSSLNKQLYLSNEVIIVDGSSLPVDFDTLKVSFSNLNIIYHQTEASVCRQRNAGIAMAKSPYIFLCDDDIEVPEDYLLKLSDYLAQNPEAGIATGYFLQKNEIGVWAYEYPITSFAKFLWMFIFQNSIWGSLGHVKTNFFTQPIFDRINKLYKKRKNTCTLAGWPLITDFSSPVIRTTCYSLGAALVKKDWLTAVPFDENLTPNGIGDHYGITINLSDLQPVHILTDTHVYHHYSSENRLKSALSYQYRTLALHYFMVKSSRFGKVNIAFLIWSLMGNLIFQLLNLQLNFAKSTFITIIKIVSGQNPLILKSKS